MFSCPRLAPLWLVLLTGLAAAQGNSKFEGCGRTAPPLELKAWDIDVRPDFRGLPPGRGTVAQGQDL